MATCITYYKTKIKNLDGFQIVRKDSICYNDWLFKIKLVLLSMYGQRYPLLDPFSFYNCLIQHKINYYVFYKIDEFSTLKKFFLYILEYNTNTYKYHNINIIYCYH